MNERMTVSQKSAARSQKPEVRSQKSEARSRRPEVGSQKSEARSRKSEVGRKGRIRLHQIPARLEWRLAGGTPALPGSPWSLFLQLFAVICSYLQLFASVFMLRI